jgi:hypothetical protein
MRSGFRKKDGSPTSDLFPLTSGFSLLYQLWFIMPQKIINLTMVNADIVMMEQTEHSESMRHFIT